VRIKSSTFFHKSSLFGLAHSNLDSPLHSDKTGCNASFEDGVISKENGCMLDGNQGGDDTGHEFESHRSHWALLTGLSLL
jgi:hypothetical protein